MATIGEVLEATIGLERKSMALYVRFATIFADDSKLVEFWMAMARDEAGHLGGLHLVATILEAEGLLERPSPLSLDAGTIERLGAMLEQTSKRVAGGVSLEQALEIALEVEESEIEDLVGNLLKASGRGGDYERYLRLLVHDLGDLAYMIERNCGNPRLLARCDALVNRHAEALARSRPSIH